VFEKAISVSELIMAKQYLRYTWVSPKLEPRTSSIHGEGVFAKELITKGEKLMEFGGELISREQAFSGNYRSRSVWIVDNNHYLALPKSDTHVSLDENLNHSCDANAWLEDAVTLIAKRDIIAGEEITLDQGTWNFDDKDYTDNQEPCSCGSANCRHMLSENDWKIPEVQERSKGHFHPMVQKMIDLKQKWLEYYWHRLFEIGVVIKGINGAIETISGTLILLISKVTLYHVFTYFTRGELLEDPTDGFMQFLSFHLQTLSNSTKTFAAIYILLHGILNIFLATQLYRQRLWAYLITIGCMLLFMVYQIYRVTHTHSVILSVITLFDFIFIVLAWHEYQYRKDLEK